MIPNKYSMDLTNISLLINEILAHLKLLKEEEEKFYLQKSRVHWLREGDTNSHFLRTAIASHTLRNCILQGSWLPC